MLKLRTVMAAATLLAMTTTLGPARAAGTTATYAYEPSTFAYSFCDKEPIPKTTTTTGHNLGAVCPVVQPGDKVRVTQINDAVNGHDVGASIFFMDKDFKRVGDIDLFDDPVGWFNDTCDTCQDVCGSMASAATAPAGSKYVYVQFMDPAVAQVFCGSLFATTGTINISIT